MAIEGSLVWGPVEVQGATTRRIVLLGATNARRLIPRPQLDQGAPLAEEAAQGGSLALEVQRPVYRQGWEVEVHARWSVMPKDALRGEGPEAHDGRVQHVVGAQASRPRRPALPKAPSHL